MYFVVKSALKMVPDTKYSAETQCANGFRESMGGARVAYNGV